MFNEAIITKDGLELDTKIRAGMVSAKFTYVGFGDGVYKGNEDLSKVSKLKNRRQRFGISSIMITDKNTVRLRIISDNEGIKTGYFIREIGVYAEDPDKGEILYSIALGVENKMDYQPSETELYGANGTFDIFTSVSNVETAVIETGSGAAASAEDVMNLEKRIGCFDGSASSVSAIDTQGIVVKSASGIGRVSIDDAGNDPILNLNIAGKSEQAVTTGAQLLTDGNLYPGFLANVDGTRTNDNNYRTVWLSLPIGTYTLSVPGEAMIVKTVIDGILNNSSTSIADGAGYTCTLTQEGFLGISFRKQDSSDYVTDPQVMLNEGATAKPWEPYTGGQPSPSPDYPQPIIGTGTVTTGAQMLDFRNGKSGTVGGITYTNVGDGTYKRTGTVTSSSGAVWFLGGYNITPNADDSNVIVTLKKGVEYIAKDCWLFWFLDNAAFSCEEGKPFTPESDIKITGVRNPWQIEGSTYNDVIRPMLVEGDTIIQWEPYTGGKPSPSEEYPQPLGVTVTGANLFDANAIKTTSSNGISFVNNNDGSITVKGTSLDSADTYGVKVDLQPGIYHTSGGQGNVKIMVRVKDNGETKYYSNHDFVVSTDSYVDIYMHVDSGKTVDITIWPMLNAGSTALPWQPYQSKTATIQLTAPLHGIGDVRDRIMCKDGEWGIERQFIALTFDGSTDEKWNEASTNDAAKKRYNCKVGGRAADLIHQTALCSHFPLIVSGGTLGNIRGFTIANDYIQLYLDGRPLEEFKTWLADNPIIVAYSVTTPTWEPLPSATQSALNALTTFTGTTHVIITSGGPEPDVAVEYFGQSGDKVTVQDMCDSFAAPAFDDSGVVPGISGFGDFLNRLTSGVRFPDFFRDLKAGLKFVLHTGQLVNNGLCNEPGKYPLDAAYGRTLLEMIGNTANLPGGAEDIVSAIVTQNSNLDEIDTTIGNHLADTENPHGVTAEQVGLGNVDNTADADKTVAIAGKVGTGTVGGATTPVYINAGTPKACTAYGSATVNKANYAGVTTVATASLKNIYAGTSSMTASSTSLTTGNIYLQYE